MNTQINLRLSGKLLTNAQKYAKEHGFGTLQEFVKETIREKVFEEADITKQELELVTKLAEVTEKRDLYGTEEELFPLEIKDLKDLTNSDNLPSPLLWFFIVSLLSFVLRFSNTSRANVLLFINEN